MLHSAYLKVVSLHAIAPLTLHRILKINYMPAVSVTATEIFKDRVISLRLELHGAIYRPDSFVLMPRYCANLKAIRYKSTSLNRIVADKSHRVIVALFP